ncbi:DSBA-like thioredoxin domain protein [Leptospira fainei serovar Hurstbridge str. BUT 6]|uniref:DSBA-like thioredoxin domain protein n=1 Tax=Leptospira fainei serovar Hurstbridge str. BUT 6 TaxID=1193011 RepID=S3UZ30_9LEPT|nr:DsbA family protein [Leptospira fainei]EPG74473.1 DSBA-like thioredoxin domain protein [Leptospira fainei serovar Hurstbridge str. BUT 6]
MELPRPTSKHSLIYVADPLCPWSYGFGQSILKLKSKYEDKIDFSLVLGGFRFGPDIESFTPEMTDRLRYLWKDVERASGRSFQYEILNRRDLVFDSEPACRAVITAQRLAPILTFEYLNALSFSFHAAGQDPTDLNTFLSVASDLSINKSDFEELYRSEETSLETKNDFNYGFLLGVTGFPTLVFSDGLERGILTKGFLPYEEVESIFADYFRSIGQF